jgi:hypothetical protein
MLGYLSHWQLLTQLKSFTPPPHALNPAEAGVRAARGR